MIVYSVISLTKTPHIHRIYVVLANPIFLEKIGLHKNESFLVSFLNVKVS
jgi:hypothetical protein